MQEDKTTAADGLEPKVNQSTSAPVTSLALTDEDRDDVAEQVEEAMETIADEITQEENGVAGLLIRTCDSSRNISITSNQSDQGSSL